MQLFNRDLTFLDSNNNQDCIVSMITGLIALMVFIAILFFFEPYPERIPQVSKEQMIKYSTQQLVEYTAAFNSEMEARVKRNGGL